MTDTRAVRAAQGRRIRLPGSGKLLIDGAIVFWGSYWERLLGAGDIEIVDPPKTAVAAPPAQVVPAKAPAVDGAPAAQTTTKGS